jgi:polyisoprenoid-binding protein YceI
MASPDAGPNAGGTRAPAAKYSADPRVSRVTVRAFAGGLLQAFAHNPTFAVRQYTCDLTLDPASPRESKMVFSAQAASLELTDHVSESDRREIERIMRDQVLEIGRFPTISFNGERVDVTEVVGGRLHATVAGTMNMHGVARPLTVEADGSMQGKTLRAFGEATIRQTEFGIKLVSVAGQAIKVKDELRCSFDIVARQHE